jgi:hypothetical protein
MIRLAALLVLLCVAGGLVACANGFPPPGNGRGILNDADPMEGGGG